MCATKFACEFFQISKYMQHHSNDIFSYKHLQNCQCYWRLNRKSSTIEYFIRVCITKIQVLFGTLIHEMPFKTFGFWVFETSKKTRKLKTIWNCQDHCCKPFGNVGWCQWFCMTIFFFGQKKWETFGKKYLSVNSTMFL